MDDLTGQRLNDYQLLRQLGRGAMASVYLAEQLSLARRVAVKVLAAELCRDQAYVDRFGHEARSAASLTHPGIVQVYEVGVADIDGARRHYLAQEYVPGGTLGHLVKRAGTFDPDRVLAILWQVGSALAAAAERGLVHRDIKPDNLMVDRTGSVKVADFGLARLLETNTPRMTQAGVAMGTPLYMSPEQIEGGEVDSRSDLYSLGVTAYQLLTGDPPFTGETPLSVAVQHLNNRPDPVAERRPETPPALAAIIDRLLAKAPADRFESPNALLDALRAVNGTTENAPWAEAEAGSNRAAEWTPRAEGDQAAIGQLASAMRAESQLAMNRRVSFRRWLVGGLAGFVLGALLATVVTPAAVLRQGGARVEQFESVKQQLFHAKTVDTPAAWQAVLSFHADADPFYQGLALRGLTLCSLRRGDNREAIAALEKLPGTTTSEAGLRDPVTVVARVVAYTRTGQADRARSSAGVLMALSAADRQRLAETLPELFAEAEASLKTL